jgi:4-amino-4-deoxy-L-arabinose transferase-like glycosyltransferase
MWGWVMWLSNRFKKGIYKMIPQTVSSTWHRFNASIERHELLTLGALVLGALLVRLIVMFSLQTYQFPTEKSMGAEMGWIARNLVNGEGFKVDIYYAWMAPLYPFILSLVFRLFGSYSPSSAIATLVMQSFVSSLVVIPIYFIGKRLFSQGAGYIAALLWVFYPSSLKYAIKSVWSSSLTALGLALMVLLFLRLSYRSERTWDALLCGLVIGLTALSNPVVITFAPVAALWLLWRSRGNLKTTLGQLAVIGITAIALLMPWIIRNYRIFHQFVPVKSTFGVNLWQGNYGPNINQWTAGKGFWYKVEDLFTEEEVAYLLSLNEVERANIFRDRAIEFIVTNPGTFVKYTLQRIYLFWRLYTYRLDAVFLVPLYSLAWIGIIISRRHWPDTILLLLLFAVFPIPYYLTIADTHRYRFPIEALILVFVAYAVGYLPRLARLDLDPPLVQKTGS